jgi:hypothetical protein
VREAPDAIGAEIQAETRRVTSLLDIVIPGRVRRTRPGTAVNYAIAKSGSFELMLASRCRKLLEVGMTKSRKTGKRSRLGDSAFL